MVCENYHSKCPVQVVLSLFQNLVLFACCFVCQIAILAVVVFFQKGNFIGFKEH